MEQRWLGLDIGAETLKVVEVTRDGDGFAWTRRVRLDHAKDPGALIPRVLADLGWDGIAGVAVTGRFARATRLPRVPVKEAQRQGMRFVHGDGPATVVSIGARGFSVLEMRSGDNAVFRENSRCSQGTGNFLRQLVGRFGLTVEDASALCAPVPDPAALSGRCPVILKTDMTHLANKGEDRARILAGLYDAVCENVQVLIKPRLSPSRVALVGGVASAPRIRENFRGFLARHGMELLETGEAGLYLEALGAALTAAGRTEPVPSLDDVLAAPEHAMLETLPALSTAAARVRRLEAPPPALAPGTTPQIVLGLDIGSTGSKAVAIDVLHGAAVWEGYRSTGGDPIGAAQALVRSFLDGPAGRCAVLATGVTGSGREIVGSLLSSCFGTESTFVLNEIAAHAAGALHHDPRVDTIFEIGGQDAKYIRLAGGRVVDAAMNEACSAGTGSFIEEQGRRFAGVENVVQLAQIGMAATSGVSLGQHCSVFMAEIIDDAIASGRPKDAIIAGIYDAVIQNYLNRVKGNRSVGQVVFCQGMPFSAPALAAAVARQTGCEVIVPPNPGTVGALGIALLARHELALADAAPVALADFLAARVTSKDTFVCNSTKGCGGSGNHCRIDRLRTEVAGTKGQFTWGGACSLHDRAARGRKLPDLAPDPFRRREELVAELVARCTVPRGRPRVAMTDEFTLKSYYPFFVAYVHELGLDPVASAPAGRAALKRGIEQANVPFCAPMQQYHGMAGQMLESDADIVLLPMMRTLVQAKDGQRSISCPIAIGAPDVVKWDLARERGPRLVSPVIEMGDGGLASEEFLASCKAMAEELGVWRGWRLAYDRALASFRAFEREKLALGREALDYCRERGLSAVVVLGRAYTIYNTVLNSNVPAILREQGALPIPLDCFPIPDDTPVYGDIYWTYAQQSLRAAEVVRGMPGVYSVYCSNYSCGPDSFAIHFYAYLMTGKPFTVIETDGHSGDAGTRTRIEAFLYCVRQDLAAGTTARQVTPLEVLEKREVTVAEMIERGDVLLVPRLGELADALAATFRGAGMRAESLPVPDRECLQLGRRYTSGKECVPLTITLGSVLKRVLSAPDGQRFGVLMPTAAGPCRFGVYNLFDKILFDQLGLSDRIEIWSPRDTNYFAQFGGGFSALAISGITAGDVLYDAFHDARSVEREPGLATEIFDRYKAELLQAIEDRARRSVTATDAVMETLRGRIFGCADILRRAATELAATRTATRRPVVLVVGEIYVRADPFANDFIIDKLEERGLTVRLAPLSEWLEYSSDLALARGERTGLGARVSNWIQHSIQDRCHDVVAPIMGWGKRVRAWHAVEAAQSYIRPELTGEAGLTIGGALISYREGEIDAAVSVGPLECMPNKLSETQFFHVAERDGLPTLTLGLNGDPVDPVVLDQFAFEVHERHRAGRRISHPDRKPQALRPLPAAAHACGTGCGCAAEER